MSDGRVKAKVRLAPAPDRLEPGRYLAVGRGAQLLVLVRRGDGRSDEIAVVGPGALSVDARYRLEAGVRYRGIVLARSGLLYAYGNQPGRLLDEASGAREEDAVVTAVDTRDGSLTTTTVRRGHGRDWWVYWGALSSDETTLVLSYHGGCGPGFFRACTSGADLVAVPEGRVQVCRTRSSGAAGCRAAVHGAVVAHQEGFIAATGSARLLKLDDEGAVVGSLRTHLRTHLMQITVKGSTLYALDSCGLRGGLSIVDLAVETARVWPSLCGDRLSVGPNGRLALAANSQPVPIGVPSRVVVAEASNGRELRSVPTHLEVLDLAFVP